MVRAVGIEPTLLTEPDFESYPSKNFLCKTMSLYHSQAECAIECAKIPSIVCSDSGANTKAGWLIAPPSLLRRLQMEVAGPSVGVSEADFDEFLRPLLDPIVRFGQGSRIIITQTPALTTIDVDAGRATNIDAVNLEAAKHIASALRARNIGGQVVVDFCRSAGGPSGRAALLKAFAEKLAADSLNVTLYGATKMGLVELSRPRLGPSLSDVISDS